MKVRASVHNDGDVALAAHVLVTHLNSSTLLFDEGGTIAPGETFAKEWSVALSGRYELRVNLTVDSQRPLVPGAHYSQERRLEFGAWPCRPGSETVLAANASYFNGGVGPAGPFLGEGLSMEATTTLCG